MSAPPSPPVMRSLRKIRQQLPAVARPRLDAATRADLAGRAAAAHVRLVAGDTVGACEALAGPQVMSS